jgi:cell division ATPase FtsA
MLCGGKDICYFSVSTYLFVISSCSDEINATVVDIGATTCRFGASGQNTPSHIFRSVSRDSIRVLVLIF